MTVEHRDAGNRDWRLRAGEPADRDALLAIWREQFGVLEGVPEWVDDALGDPANVEAVVAVDAEDGGGTPIGFAVVALLDPETVSGYVRGVYPPERFPERTGVIHLLAVDDEHTDGAVGTALTRRCMDRATGETPLMLVLLWRREDRVDSSVLAEHFDYDEVVRIKGYYRTTREHCPDCGDTCTCDATVHVRALPG